MRAFGRHDRSALAYWLLALLLSAGGPSWARAQQTAAPVAEAALTPSAWTPLARQRAAALSATYGQPKGACARGQAMIASTSGATAIMAGAAALRAGGSSADAAVTIALAQTVLCAGAWDSFAGMLYALHYDAATGQVLALNAGFDIPRGETDPLSIPHAPTPSGRTALVGGFTAGVDSLHRRFGRLPWAALVQPAIELADSGFVVDAFVGRMLAAKEAVLARTAAGREMFFGGGRVPAAGDRLRQSALAATLRLLAAERSAPFYKGTWARHCVDAVRGEGGLLALDDLAAYRARWEAPLRTAYHGFDISTLGAPELGGVQLVEGLNLLELAAPPRAERAEASPHYSKDAPALDRFIQICRAGYAITYAPSFRPDPAQPQVIPWISPLARTEASHAAALWRRMQQPGWEEQLVRDLTPAPPPAGGGHSDCIVVADAQGNITALVHSINSGAWGSTGIFVDGVSIPDPASFQQDIIARVGPGHRLPNVVNPTIALRGGKPVLAACAIGNALHECMLQALVDVLDFGLAPPQAMAMPRFWGPWWGGEPGEYARQAIDADGFAPDVVAEVEAMGQPLRALTAAERRGRVSYWAAIELDPATGLLCGAAPPDFNGLVEVVAR